MYKNKLFKVQKWKTNFMQSLRTKTIVYPWQVILDCVNSYIGLLGMWKSGELIFKV